MAELAWKERPSPNYNKRPDGIAIDMLILHYTGMPIAAEALDRLTDPKAEVSCHWLIEEDGTIWRLVPEEFRAWHAGVSFWAGSRDINSRSIGIELANPGHEWGYHSFADPQMTALIRLAQAILARHPIPPSHILGHADVAPSRKKDPGELFDWARLAAAGIGIWPALPAVPAADNAPFSEAEAVEALVQIGYEAPDDKSLHDVITAFQRHFLQNNLTGYCDAMTIRRIIQIWKSFSKA